LLAIEARIFVSWPRFEPQGFVDWVDAMKSHISIWGIAEHTHTNISALPNAARIRCVKGVTWFTRIRCPRCQAQHSDKGDSTFLPSPRTQLTTDHKLEWFGTSRSRLGFLAAHTFTATGLTVATATVKDVKAGWTAGA